MSPEELYASLCRITENPRQPFSFLANISNEFADGNQSSMETGKSTEIDIQLAAVAKRIESTKILLDKAKSYVEDIRLRAKQNVCQSSEINGYYDDKTKVEKEEQFS
ncbi:glucosamine--fructose-6-phosphate aminotransferase [Lasius niger]|uniref:Glucosamine--fructose-6-phosphate aminotransferase n=1 Tax=Lasius niger TaxID=67767 RepID=A0A0J7KSC6_LASNI|nr:glucosamine--fructose-6-phosphate aminotransferase [Lasius niger]